MNVPKLLHTTLFSVLALLLTGGLMAAQAQNTVRVDEDDPNADAQTISNGLSQVDEDGDVLVILAGSYNEDLNVTTGATGGISGGESFTVEAREDNDSGAQEVAITEFEIGDNLGVTVESDGGGFLGLSDTAGDDLILTDGSLSISASRDLQLLNDGVDVQRTDVASVSTNAPTFPTDVNVTYDVTNGDITAGLEAPADVGSGDITIQGGSGNAVDFPQSRFASVSAGQVVFNGTDDVVADFAGDLAVTNVESNGTDDLVSADQSLLVDGQLVIAGQNNGLTADASAANGDEVSVGSLEFSSITTGNTLVDGTGSLTVEGEAAFLIDFTGGAAENNTDEDFVQAISPDQANDNGDSFAIGSVATETRSDNNEQDETFVDLEVTSDHSLTLSGGTVRDIDVNSSAASLTIGGDVTADLTATVLSDASSTSSAEVINNGDPIEGDNAEGNGGSLTIADGSTLTASAGDVSGSSTVTHVNQAGIGGQGTIEFTVADDTESHTVTRDDPDATTDNELVNSLPDVVAGAGSGLTLDGEVDPSSTVDAGIQISGSLDVTGDVTLANVEAKPAAGPIPQGGADIGGNIDVNGGTFNPNLSGSTVAERTTTTTSVIHNSGTVDLSTSTERLEITGNYDRASDGPPLTTDGNSTLAFTGSSDGFLSIGTLTRLNGELIVDRPQATLTLQEALRVDGDVTIADQGQFANTTLLLQDNLFVTIDNQGSGRLTLNSNLDVGEDNNLVFEANAYDVTGDDTLSTSIVDLKDNLNNAGGGGNDTDDKITISSDLEFDSTIDIRDGGIDVTAGNDLSPAEGYDAEIRRRLVSPSASAQPDQTNIAGSGDFNDDENGYNLTYAGSATANTDAELTDQVVDLTVDQTAQPELTNGATVNGDLTVTAGAQIGDDNGGPYTLELVGSDASHSVVGEVQQTSGTVVEIEASGSGAEIAGSTDNDNDSTVEVLTVSATDVSVSDVQQIDGNVTVEDGAGLSLALSDAADDGLSGGTAGDNDQSIEGQVTANGQLTLASAVEVTAIANSDAVQVAASGTSGALDFGSSDLTITGDGAQFDGNGDATYSSSGGTLVFNNQVGNNNQSFGTAGVPVPRVQVASDVDVDLSEEAATSELLDVDAALDLSNDFEVEGDVELAADVSVSGGVFRSVGATITLESDQDIEEFTVDSGSDGTTTIASDDSDTPRDLEVSTQFILDSGELAHGQNDLSITDGSDGAFTYVAGSVSATSGFIDLDGSGNALDLDQAVSIPNLRVSDDAELGDDDVNLTVASELELDNEFDATTSGGDIVMADGALVQRLPGTSVNGVEPLEEALAANGTYNVTYGDGTNVSGNSGDRDFNSGFELDGSNVSVLTVNTGSETSVTDEGGAVYLEADELTGDVTVDELVLNDGDFDYGRQLVIADEGTVTRRPGSGLSDEPNNDTGDADSDDPSALSAEGTFALVYDGDDGVDPGSDLEATGLEFTSDVSSLTTTTGDASNGNEQNVEVDFAPRTVDSLEVNHETSSSNTNLDDVQVTVNDDLDVLSGTLSSSNDGEVAVSGNVNVDGATLSADADVEGNTEVTNDGTISSADYTTAGDFVVESGNLNGTPDVTFDGDEQNLTLNSGSEAFGGLTMAQQDADSRVFLTGDVLDMGGNTMTFRDGLLVVPESEEDDEVYVNLSDPGNASNSTVPVDHNPNTLSHVVGRVNVGIPAGTPTRTGGRSANERGRYVFPVGSTTEYRPASFTLRTDDPIEVNVNITIGHVDENPGGTIGLDSIDDVGSYPSQYWFLTADQGLGSSQEFDLELETGTEGFVDEFEDADNLRIIRRFGSTANDWRQQGESASYDNNLFTRTEAGTTKEIASVRTQESTGGVTQQEARFTIGLPGRGPVFTDSPSDQSVDEGESTGPLTLTATSRDVGQNVTLTVPDDSLPDGVEPDSVTFDPDVNDEAPSDTLTASFEFTPGFEGGDRTLTFTVVASDEDTTATSKFDVSVTDVAQGVEFADGAAPSDVSVTARDTARTSDNPATFQVTAEADDPGSDGSALSFDTDVDWASASVASTSGDQATATVTLGPGFAQAQSAVQGDGTLDVGITATDGNTSESTSGTASVDVEFDRNVGDVDGSGSISGFDASFALAIAVGKTEFNGGAIVDAEVRAADFVPPSQGDTLDANRDDVNSFDALRIFQDREGAGGATVATQKASTSGRQSGLIQVGEMDKKDGTALVPIVLEEGSGVQAADVEVELSSGASVKGIQTSVPEEWISKHNAEDGVLKIGMAGEQALPTGKIATVRLDLSGSEEPFEGGTFRVNGAGAEDLPVETAPSEFKLGSNYPNPVESETTIEYDLKEASSVTIEVYNTLGQKVATLVDQEKEAGSHTVRFEAGSDLSSGVYFYRMRAGDFNETKRITVVR
jgi:hypothetical protein